MNFDRTKAEDLAKKKSARADMKQHADKLIQGFEKLNDSHAKRAIWELVQNACDLSKHCEIVIDFSKDGFSFSHNGKPFNSETLISLIKQVSSKSPDNENEIGQFGTGFITTHSFGKKFKLNSVLKEGEFHVDIKDFLIDRHAKGSDELLDKLEQQETNVYQLIRSGSVLDAPVIQTTFSYLSDSAQDKINITQAENNLHHYIPIVLALNTSLMSVKVVSSDGSVVQYKKGEEDSEKGIVRIPVLKNDVPINIYCLRSEDKSIQIILPLSEIGATKQKEDSIAKLFLFFPLIGTENWGCNFIIHSKLFAPTEPRDGIHIKSKNEQIQEKEKTNTGIIEAASELIFGFVERFAETVADPINLAFINFDTITNTELTNNYYNELQKKWIAKFKTLKLVENENGRGTPSDVLFLSSRLLQDDNYFDAIYKMASMFWKDQLPKKDVAKKWTSIVNDWEVESKWFVTVEMLMQKIQEQGDFTKFDEKTLHSVYEYLIKYNELTVFDDYKLLPNIKGELVRRGELKRPVNIDVRYIDVSNIIIPEVPKQFIKNSFELGLEFNNYNRKKLSEDFNTRILSLIKEIAVDKDKLLDTAMRDGLIALCSIYPSENTQSIRRQVMPKICSFYNLEYSEQFIPNVEDEKFDYDYTPFRGLIKNFLLDIVKKGNEDKDWVKTEITFLKDCLSIITPLKDLRDIIEAISVFPNQNFELCNQVKLRIEKLFPIEPEGSDFLKEIYKEIIHDIRKELVLKDFAEFLFHTNEQTGLELSSKLEQEFKEKGTFEDITNHPNKGVIFQIIKRITNNKEWATFFPTIDDKKAVVMMAKISDNSIKDDLFSILGLEDKNKISLLGDLSKNPELERIIRLGKQALEEEYRGDADFEFKKKIGVHIEDLIRNKIQKEVENLSITINEEQGGQDIVVKLNEEAAYFIEVKSRWNIGSSITMSNLQIKNATKNKERYSLCCVEMSDYNPDDGNRYAVKEINEIKDRIKFVNDIGNKIEPLILNALFAESNEDEVKLTDEYRAIVPQPVVQKGMDIDHFVDHLITFLGLMK